MTFPFEITAKQRYLVDSKGYNERAYHCLNAFLRTKHIKHLFYCCFELRCAFERFFYELLDVTKDSEPSKSEKKKYKPHEILTHLKEIDPGFNQRIRFASLMIIAMFHRDPIGPPDLKQLKKDWDYLGEVMHGRKKPLLDEEVTRLHKLVSEIRFRIAKATTPLWSIDFGDIASGLFNEYYQDKLSDDIMIEKIRAVINKTGGI